MTQTFFDMLDHWQSLVAGEIAIPAAVLTFGGVYWLSRSDRRRKLRASRTLMPAALSIVSDYAHASVNWLIEARKPLAKVEQGKTIEDSELPGAPPEPDVRAFDILKDCVEHSPDAPAKSVATLLSAMQVFRSRVSGIGDRVNKHKSYRGGRVLMEREVNQQIVDAVKLSAMTDGLFPFARMETDEAPPPLDLNAVATAFKLLELNEFQEVEVWNALTDPYLKKHQMHYGQ